MRLRSLSLAVLLLGPATATAQAPPTADLWLVATTSLAIPPALEDGITAALWNPAAAIEGRVGLGLAIVQPPDVLGLTALAIAGGYRLESGLQFTALVTRIHARDLVRTTTSPTSQLGDIQVYDQIASLGVSLHRRLVSAGAQLRLHDSRFDVIRERGMTVDVGLHLRPVDRLHLAAATHFLPPGLGATPATDYYLGAAFDVGPHRGRRGLGVTPRYGVTLHAEGGLDHHGGVGVRLGIPIEFNAMVSREAQGGDVIWRPAFAVHLRIGPYAIGATRGSGVRDIGATYRVVVDLAL